MHCHGCKVVQMSYISEFEGVAICYSKRCYTMLRLICMGIHIATYQEYIANSREDLLDPNFIQTCS